MTSGSDPIADDALGADASPPATELPRGWRAVGKGSQAVHTAGDEGDAAVTFAGDDELDLPVAAPTADSADSLTLSNASLLGIGVLAGVYLLYTIGWFLGVDRIGLWAPMFLAGGGGTGSPLGGDFHFAVLRWLAIAAPFVWFVVTFVLSRHSRAWVRFAWLIAGALLLVPWPLLTPFAPIGATS